MAPPLSDGTIYRWRQLKSSVFIFSVVFKLLDKNWSDLNCDAVKILYPWETYEDNLCKSLKMPAPKYLKES